MSTITTRSGKGSPLTNNEVDANFTNLNADKAELSGATFTGEITANGGIALGDSDQATFGDGDDLKLYHTGSHSYIDENGTGNLYIGSNNGAGVYIQGSGETLASFVDDGAVTLYNNNVAKLATTATGIDVTGTATMDGLTVNTTNGSSVFEGTGISSVGIQFKTNASNRYLIQTPSSSADLAFLAGGTTKSLNLASNGDISFYEDTGTTAKITWSASNEDLNFADNVKATFGASDDLQIYHDGSMSYIDDAGNGDLRIRASNDISFRNYANEATAMNLSLNNGSELVQLYYAGSLRLATSATGIDVTGTVTADGLTVDGTTATIQDDSANLRFENSAGTRTGYIQNRADAFEIWDDQATPMTFGTSNAERMRIDSAGTLFQGTTSPTLHSSVTGTVFTNGSLLTEAARGANKSLTLAQNVAVDAGNTWAYLSTDEASYYQQYGGNHYFATAASGTAGADATLATKMIILNNGNVGIGTSSPSYALHVATNLGFTAEFQNTAGANHRPVRWTDNTGASVGTLGADFTADEFILQAISKPLVFGTGTDGTERMRIDASGNVGIGTTNPARKLAVEGTGVIFNNTGGAHEVLFGDAAYRYFSLYTPASPEYMSIRTGSTDLLTVKADGNVGIGTSSPAAKFQVDDGTGAALFVGLSSNIYYRGYEHIWQSQNNTVERMRIDSSGNVILAAGTGTLQTATAGTSNLRLGVNAGNSIIAGGNYNTVVGDEAGTAITTGDQNVAIGFEALSTATTASRNTAVGLQALRVNTGDDNSAFGYGALISNTTGTYNTAIGRSAGFSVTTGTNNTLIGGLAGDATTTGGDNVALLVWV
jgi:hypothetical protein